MSGKTIVITGASSGIGAELAVQLAAEGHRLVLGARREAELGAVAARAGRDAVTVVTDVTRRGDVERLRDRAIARSGGVDVWINNAGQGITRSVLDLTDEDFDAVMAVNVKSALYGMQAIVPHFIARGEGHLVNVSSFLSRVPAASYRSAYNAAKAALNALTANLRMDLAAAHPGIHVSLVMPGLVATDFGRHAIGGAAARPTGADAAGAIGRGRGARDRRPDSPSGRRDLHEPRAGGGRATIFRGRGRLRAGRARGEREMSERS